MQKVGSEYTVHELLGSGATGEVWRGTDGHGRPVAVKILRPEYSRRRDVVRRFIQERDLLTEIEHPHVVSVHDLVYDRSTLAIVMDLVEGGDLATVLHREGPMPPDRVRAIGAGIAMGLAAIHAADIVHLDLKPGNVLLSRSGTALIADLGVSQLARGPAGVAEHPRFGTPQYTAPEIVLGGQVGSAADVYALGLLLVEMLQGHPAVDAGSDVLGVLDAQVDRHIPRPPGTDDELWSVIAPMLEKDPSDRPTAWESALALGAPSDGLGETALHGHDTDAQSPDAQDRPLFPDAAASGAPGDPQPADGPPTVHLGHRTSLLRSAQTVALDQPGPKTIAMPRREDPHDLLGPPSPPDGGGGRTSAEIPAPPGPGISVGRSRRPLLAAAAGALLLAIGLVAGAATLLPHDDEPEPTSAPTTAQSSEPAPTTSVSVPPGAIVVPDVRGLTEQAARGEIHGGLRVDTVTVEGTAADDGTVVGTDPIPGTPVSPGDTVTLQVARELATLPLTDLHTAPRSGQADVTGVVVGGSTHPGSLLLTGPDGMAESQIILQKRYIRLDGGVTVPDGAPEARVQILVDQVPIFDETVAAGSTVPLDVEVADVNQLTFSVTSASGDPVEVALTEAVLHGEKGRVPGS